MKQMLTSFIQSFPTLLHIYARFNEENIVLGLPLAESFLDKTGQNELSVFISSPCYLSFFQNHKTKELPRCLNVGEISFLSKLWRNRYDIMQDPT